MSRFSDIPEDSEDRNLTRLKNSILFKCVHPRLYASNQFTFFEEKVKPIVQIDRIKPNNQKVEGFKKDAIIQVRNHKMRTQK